MEAHKIDPQTGEDEIGAAKRGCVPAMAGNGGPARRAIRKIPQAGARSAATKYCPCGSGKKYKHCHGRYA